MVTTAVESGSGAVEDALKREKKAAKKQRQKDARAAAAAAEAEAAAVLNTTSGADLEQRQRGPAGSEPPAADADAGPVLSTAAGGRTELQPPASGRSLWTSSDATSSEMGAGTSSAGVQSHGLGPGKEMCLH